MTRLNSPHEDTLCTGRVEFDQLFFGRSIPVLAAMLALLSDFASYQSYLSSVVRFSSWCSNNFLHLNVSKTKEMCIDFRRNRTVITPIVINGEPVEQVD